MNNKLPVLSSEAFILEVASLMDQSDLDLDATRQLLSRAPLEPGVMTAHGLLIARLMDNVGKTPEAIDAQLLAAYFQGIIRLGPLLMQKTRSARGSYGRNPAYDALNTVMANLGTAEGMGRTHAVLLAMTQRGLMDPNEVLSSLGNVQEQVSYCECEHDSSDLKDTAYGAFLYALRPLVVEAQWFPSVPSGVQHLWEVHDGLTILEKSSSEPNEAAFIEALVHKDGAQLPHALAFLARKSRLHPALMDAFFPLPFEACPARPVLDHLVGFLTSTSEGFFDDNAQPFMELLAVHHPEIHALMQIHVDLFPEPELAQDNVGMLTEGFEQLRGRGKAVDIAMDGALFG